MTSDIVAAREFVTRHGSRSDGDRPSALMRTARSTDARNRQRAVSPASSSATSSWTVISPPGSCPCSLDDAVYRAYPSTVPERAIVVFPVADSGDEHLVCVAVAERKRPASRRHYLRLDAAVAPATDLFTAGRTALSL